MSILQTRNAELLASAAVASSTAKTSVRTDLGRVSQIRRAVASENCLPVSSMQMYERETSNWLARKICVMPISRSVCFSTVSSMVFSLIKEAADNTAEGIGTVGGPVNG